MSRPISDLVADARANRRRVQRDRLAAEAAAAQYQAEFERLDDMAHWLRDNRWPEGADLIAQKASIAYIAARAERRSIEGRAGS